MQKRFYEKVGVQLNWGNGEWGDVTDSGGSFTGIAMSATLGSVTIGADINTGGTD